MRTLAECIGRLVCMVKGHADTDKLVVGFSHVKSKMPTCDRCGDGRAEFNRTLAFAKCYIRSQPVEFGEPVTPRKGGRF